MTTFSFTTGNPANLTGGANASMNDIQGPLNDLKTFLNGGNIDATNLANGAATDAKLASPNNAVWRPIFATTMLASMSAMALSTVYYADAGGVAVASGSSSSAPFIWVAPLVADEAVAGKTATVRLRTVVVANGIAPATNIVTALYAATFSGGSGAFIATLGGVAGSLTTTSNPGAGANAPVVSSGTALSAFSGPYAFGASIAANGTAGSRCVVQFSLEMAHV